MTELIFETLDRIIHSVPVLPKKMQGSTIDKIWKMISQKQEV